MKYFISVDERKRNENEKFIEFRPMVERGARDGKSLYISESVIKETGFWDFWVQCMEEDLVFDMDTISKNDLALMRAASIVSGREVKKILGELTTWAVPYLWKKGKYIEVVHYRSAAGVV